jgi:nitrate reductase NapE component
LIPHRPALIARTSLLIVTLWVGSLWTIGYLAAPTLFATLYDRVLAGTVAGSLFRSEAWLSLSCGVALLSLQYRNAKRTTMLLIAAMLLCTVVGYFGLQPWMAQLREAAGPAGVMAGSAHQQFAMLHGISMGIYLIESLLGAWLLFKIREN